VIDGSTSAVTLHTAIGLAAEGRPPTQNRTLMHLIDLRI
jgi:hypothetical protein